MGLLASRLVRRLWPGVAATHDDFEPFRAAWERSNAADRDGDGPLWLVLGDSTAQGIGAPAFDRGYVGQLRRLLEARDGRRWRLANESVSGARLRDLLARLQSPRTLPVRPDLVTCACGSNDVAWRPGLRGPRRDLERVIAALPAGAVLATLPRGLGRRRTEILNDVIRTQAPARGLVVADVWAHTGPPWAGKLAADGFHPSELGYWDWTAAFAAALGLRLDGAP